MATGGASLVKGMENFQADLQLVRRLRREYAARESAMKEAAECAELGIGGVAGAGSGRAEARLVRAEHKHVRLR